MHKLVLIVNPESGKKKGRTIARKLYPFLEGFQVNQIITTFPGSATESILSCDLEKCRMIVVVGGDGTIHEVINGLMKRDDGIKPPLSIVPAGTGNSLAHDLGISGIEEAIEVVQMGRQIEMDIAEIAYDNQVIYSFNVVGWGVPTNINILAEKIRWFRGQRYNVAALYEIMKNRGKEVRLEHDQGKVAGEVSFIVACNTIHTGNGMRLAPKARINDGLIDLLVVKKISRMQLLKLFLKVFKGAHIPHPLISYFQVKSFTIDSERALLNVDGEITGLAPCSVTVIPSAIRILAAR